MSSANKLLQSKSVPCSSAHRRVTHRFSGNDRRIKAPSRALTIPLKLVRRSSSMEMVTRERNTSISPTAAANTDRVHPLLPSVPAQRRKRARTRYFRRSSSGIPAETLAADAAGPPVTVAVNMHVGESKATTYRDRREEQSSRQDPRQATEQQRDLPSVPERFGPPIERQYSEERLERSRRQASSSVDGDVRSLRSQTEPLHVQLALLRARQRRRLLGSVKAATTAYQRSSRPARDTVQ